ncbi:PAS domain-containing protein [Chenggangzhangella methanolivorans]|uniref:PAS domain S-box protein n=1 Tax=Chenggangzhangella methanolivorans TaxID=1437009 RepID=A0A9E6UMC2_9HYPH|nr:PAS domain S-box protein [Chenggangzhangella methanolivorans]QZN99895.1 PAS domain S-box protein [Chenggangzhangella methanolivorans]
MSEAISIDDLVANAGDAVIVSDADGVIVVWNDAASRVFGFSADEAMGETLDIITPERHRKRHWDGYAKSMETGETRYGDGELLKVPALHKDGRKLSIAFTVGMLFGSDGKPSGVAAIVRDETDRWAKETDMRKRISELEARVTDLQGPVQTGA